MAMLYFSHHMNDVDKQALYTGLNETSGRVMAPASFPCTGCVTFSIACEYSVPTGVTEAWPQSFGGLLPP